MSELVLESNNVKKIYNMGETTTEALKGVSVSVKRGEFTAIVGSSGSGKSTFLHLSAALDKPTSGKITILGEDLDKMDDKRLSKIRNEEIGFVFQSFNLIPVLTVFENIEYPCLVYRENRKNRARIDRLLRDVGMYEKRDKFPSQLSGGERQRVAIARALINKPSIVFADEPTANLDVKTGNKIMELMSDLNKNYGTTFLFTTHDPHIMDWATRKITISDGLLVGA